MTRWKAATTHLAISALIAACVVTALYLIWYPPPLFQASGLRQFLIILLGVDVVAGPLLTFVVYKTGKRGLRFDLTLIALAQAIALSYGLHVMWEARPVYYVAAAGRVTVITANDIPTKELGLAKDTEYLPLPSFGARLVGAIVPTEAKSRLELLQESLSGGSDLEQRPRYYVSYPKVSSDMARRGLPVQELLAADVEGGKNVLALLEKNSITPDSTLYLPAKTPQRFIVALIEKHTGAWIGFADANPLAVGQGEAQPTDRQAD
ncbi:MAG: TfpX/TfpZ family type IV pilin accessory protein [Lysobacteraceae bacterium]